jgi:hypothetical protein
METQTDGKTERKRDGKTKRDRETERQKIIKFFILR